MTLNIKINNFEGPFDLLLHLIKENKMNIYDIKIYDITNQYIKLINETESMDIEIASEFIVMAATLLEIKSKMLLPKDTILKDEDNEEDDPRSNLVKSLIEYKKFKFAAEFLKNRQAGTTYSKKAEIIKEDNFSEKNIFKNITITKLYNIYCDVIERYKNKINDRSKIPEQISMELFKVEDKIDFIDEKLKKKSYFTFSYLVSKQESKLEKVVTFLALLELIRLRKVKVIQEEVFEEIYIERI